MNAWGIYSINRSTFNTCVSRDYTYPKPIRDIAYTALKANNFVLNVLGYIPIISLISGSVRILVGVIALVGSLCIGNPNAKNGLLIGPFYWEAITTSIAQIARGALEAFVPFGQFVNLGLDIVATPYNLISSEFWDFRHGSNVYLIEPPEQLEPTPAMEAPTYPMLLKPLHIV